MNKIYKVVWNATRGCYVVASELVKTHQGKKSTRRGGSILSRAGTALLLAIAGWGAACNFIYADVTVADQKKYGHTVTVNNIANSGKQYDITNQQVKDGNALNKFNDFGIKQHDVANLHMGEANHQINVVKNKIDIDGVVNAIKDNKIGGDVYFFSNAGIAVGEHGVFNVGRLTLGTNAAYGEALYNGGMEKHLAQSAASQAKAVAGGSDISLNGKVYAQSDVVLGAGSVNVKGGEIRTHRNNADTYADKKAAEAYRNQLVKINTPSATVATPLGKGDVALAAVGVPSEAKAFETKGAIVIDKAYIDAAGGDTSISASAERNAGNFRNNQATATVDISGSTTIKGNNVDISAEAKVNTQVGTDAAKDLEMAEDGGILGLLYGALDHTDLGELAAVAKTDADARVTVKDSDITAGKDLTVSSSAESEIGSKNKGDHGVGINVGIAGVSSKVDIQGTSNLTAGNDIGLSAEGSNSIELQREGESGDNPGTFDLSWAEANTDVSVTAGKDTVLKAQKDVKVSAKAERSLTAEVEGSTGDDGTAGVAVGVILTDTNATADVQGNVYADGTVSVTAENTVAEEKGAYSADTIQVSNASESDDEEEGNGNGNENGSGNENGAGDKNDTTDNKDNEEEQGSAGNLLEGIKELWSKKSTEKKAKDEGTTAGEQNAATSEGSGLGLNAATALLFSDNSAKASLSGMVRGHNETSGAKAVNVNAETLSRTSVRTGVSQEADKSIGIAAAVNYIDQNDKAEAELAGDIKTMGDVSVTAETKRPWQSGLEGFGKDLTGDLKKLFDSDDSFAVANLTDSWTQTAGAGEKVSGAASLNIMEYNNTAKATVKKDTKVEIGNGDLAVSAKNDIHTVNFSGDIKAPVGDNPGTLDFWKGMKDPLSGGGKAALGGAALTVHQKNTAEATVEDGVTVTKAKVVSVTAENKGSNLSIAGAGGKGQTVAIDGTVNVNRFENTTKATVGEATINADGDVSVNAEDNSKTINIGGAIAVSEQAGIGATVAYNHIDRQTEASLQGTVTSQKDVSVTAKNTGAIYAMSAAGGVTMDSTEANGAGSTGLKAQEGGEDSQSTSSIGELAEKLLNAGKSDKDKEEIQEGDSALDNIAGQDASMGENVGKAKGGFAAAANVSVNRITDTAKASVAKQDGGTAPSVTADALTIRSGNDSKITTGAGAIALGLSQKSQAIAGSFMYNAITDENEAYAEDATLSLTGSEKDDTSLTVEADNAAKITNIAASGSGASKGSAVAGQISLNWVGNTTDAHVKGGSLKAGKAATISAKDRGTINSYTGAVAISPGNNGAAVGASIAANLIDGKTTSSLEDTTVNSGGALSVTADEASQITSIVAAGAASGKFAGAFSASGNYIHTDTDAHISNKNEMKTGALSVLAKNGSNATIGVGSAAIGGNTAGASIGVMVNQSAVSASLTGDEAKEKTITADGITVKADNAYNGDASENDQTAKTAKTVAVGFAGGTSQFAGSGSVTVNVIDQTTDATIGKGKYDAGKKDVQVEAKNAAKLFGLAGGVSLSAGSGIGAAVDVQTYKGHTYAGIADGASLKNASSVTVNADSKEHLTSVAATLASGAGTLAGAGAAGAHSVSTDTKAYVGQSEVTDAGDVSVTAKDETELKTIAGSGAASSNTGVGLTAAVEVVNKKASAIVGDDAKVTGRSLTVKAENTSSSVTSAAGLGAAGTASLAGAASETFVTHTTDAHVGKNTQVSAVNGVDILAHSNFTQGATAGSVGVGGTVGAGLTNSTVSFTGDTAAYADEKAVIDGGKKVNISASQLTNVDYGTVAGAVGGTASLSGTVGVNVLKTTTKAYAAGSSQLSAKTADAEGIAVTASDETTLKGGNGGASIGVSGGGAGAAIGVTNISKDTEAFLGGSAALDTAGKTKISAENKESLTNVTVQAAGGLYAGLAGAVNVTNLSAVTKAYTGDDVSFNQADKKGGDVTVEAKHNIDKMTSAVAGAAVGAGALGAAADIGTIRTQTNAFLGRNNKLHTDGALVIDAADHMDGISTNAIAAAVGGFGVAGSVSVYSFGSIMSDSDAAMLSGKTSKDGGESSMDDWVNGEINKSQTGNAMDVYQENTNALTDVKNKLGTTFQSETPDMGEKGTLAQIGAGSKVSAGSVRVAADDKLAVSNIMGNVSAGGSAAGISVNVVRTDTLTQAKTGENSSIRSAGDVQISAGSDHQMKSDIVGASLSGGISAQGTEETWMDKSIVRALAGTRSSITSGGQTAITSSNVRSLDAKLAGASVALSGALNGAVITADVSGSSEAGTGSGASIDAKEEAKIDAEADTKLSAKAVGAALGTYAGTGTGVALSSEVAAKADVGNQTVIHGKNISVTAKNTPILEARAVSAGLGIAGVGITISEAQSKDKALVRVGDNANLSADEALAIRARMDKPADSKDYNAYAQAIAGAGGVVSGAVGLASVDMAQETKVSIGSSSGMTAKKVTIAAEHNDTENVEMDSVSAGGVSGTGGETKVTVASDAGISIGRGSTITTAEETAIRAENVTEKAWRDGSDKKNEKNEKNVSSIGAALASGNGVVNETSITHVTTVDLDAVTIKANASDLTDEEKAGGKTLYDKNAIAIDAASHVISKDRSTLSTGAAVGAAHVKNTNSVAATTTAHVGEGSQLLAGETEKAKEKDKTASYTGAAQSPYSSAYKGGSIAVGTRNDAELASDTLVDVYGAAGYAGSENRVTYTGLANTLFAGSAETAKGDISAMAGRDSRGETGTIRASAHSDILNATAIPISIKKDPVAKIDSRASLTVDAAANMQSDRDIHLKAKAGSLTALGSGEVKDWVNKVVGALGADGSSIGRKEISLSADVTMDGKAETGIHRNKSITIGGQDKQGSWETTVKSDGDISYIYGGTTIVGKELSERLAALREKLADFGADDSTKAAYEAEIQFLEEKMAAQGLGYFETDGKGNKQFIELPSSDTSELEDAKKVLENAKNQEQKITDSCQADQDKLDQQKTELTALGTEHTNYLGLQSLADAKKTEADTAKNIMEQAGSAKDIAEGNRNDAYATLEQKAGSQTVETYIQTHSSDESVKHYNECNKAYETAVQTYNTAASAYRAAEEAATDSQKAADASAKAYSDAVTKYNGDYSDTIDTDVTKYDSTAIDAKGKVIDQKKQASIDWQKQVAGNQELLANQISATEKFYANDGKDANGTFTKDGASVITVDANGNPVPEGTEGSYYLLHKNVYQQMTHNMKIDDITAQLGDILFEGDNVSGSGTLHAGGDASVSITNASPNTLTVGDIQVVGRGGIDGSGQGGTIFYNDVELKGDMKAAIEKENKDKSMNVGFAVTTRQDTAAPSITVKNTFQPSDYKDGDMPHYAASTTTLAGYIYNPRGSVTVESKNGDVYNDGTIYAGTVDMKVENGDFIQSLSDKKNSIFHVGGAPLDDTGGLHNVDKDSGILANGNIFISARYVNINSRILSGIADWDLTIPKDCKFYYEDTNGNKMYVQSKSDVPAGRTVCVEGATGRAAEKLSYDFDSGRFIVDDIEVHGGKVSIVGTIINTTNDKSKARIEALDGYGQISIRNDSGKDIELRTLSTGEGTEGWIELTDLDRGTGKIARKTTYTRDGGKIHMSLQNYQNGAPSGNAQDTVLAKGTDGTYTPVAGSYYTLQTGTDKSYTTTYELHKTKVDWWGIENKTPTGQEVLDQGGTITDYKQGDTRTLNGGAIITTTNDLNGGPTGETYKKTTKTINNKTESIFTKKSKRLWYTVGLAKKFDYKLVEKKYDTTIHQYSQKADYDIGIRFIGDETGGKLNVNGGTGNVIVNGTISNGLGEATFSAGGIQQGARGYIDTNTLTMTATTGSAGTRDAAIKTNAMTVSGSAAKDFGVKVVNHGVTAGSITAGAAAIQAEGDISQQAGTKVHAGRVELASGGAIQGANGSFLIEAGQSEGKDYGLKASAEGHISIENTSGDLYLDSVISKEGDVSLKTNGSFIDNNYTDLNDKDATAKLLGWANAAVLEGSAATVEKQKTLLKAKVESKYNEYQSLAAYVKDGKYTLDETARAALEKNGVTDIDKYIADKQARYDALKGTVGTWTKDGVEDYKTKSIDNSKEAIYGKASLTADSLSDDTYLTAKEKAEVLVGSAKSAKALLITFAPGSIKEGITDTNTTLKGTPHVSGKAVTLTAGEAQGSIGQKKDGMTIDLSDMTRLTREQLLALSAAERGDFTVVNGNTVKVSSIRAIDAEAKGKLQATADKGAIYLVTEGSIAGDSTFKAGDEIRLKAAGNVAGVTLTSDKQIVLESGEGAISGVTIQEGGTLTARAKKGVSLSKDGDLVINTIYASDGDVVLDLKGHSLLAEDGHDADEETGYTNVEGENISINNVANVKGEGEGQSLGMKVTGKKAEDGSMVPGSIRFQAAGDADITLFGEAASDATSIEAENTAITNRGKLSAGSYQAKKALHVYNAKARKALHVNNANDSIITGGTITGGTFTGAETTLTNEADLSGAKVEGTTKLTVKNTASIQNATLTGGAATVDNNGENSVMKDVTLTGSAITLTNEGTVENGSYTAETGAMTITNRGKLSSGTYTAKAGTMGITNQGTIENGEYTARGDLTYTDTAGASLKDGTLISEEGKAQVTAHGVLQIKKLSAKDSATVEADHDATIGTLNAKSVSAKAGTTLGVTTLDVKEHAELSSGGAMTLESASADTLTAKAGTTLDVTKIHTAGDAGLVSGSDMVLHEAEAGGKLTMSAGGSILAEGENAKISGSTIEMTAGEDIRITDRSPVGKLDGVDMSTPAGSTTGSGAAGSLVTGEAKPHDFDASGKGSALLSSAGGKVTLSAKKVEIDTLKNGKGNAADLTISADNIGIDDLAGAGAQHVTIHGKDGQSQAHYAGIHSTAEGGALVKDSAVEHLHLTGREPLGLSNTAIGGDSLLATDKIRVTIQKNPGSSQAEHFGNLSLSGYDIATDHVMTSVKDGLTVNGERFPMTAESVMNASLYEDRTLGRDGREKEEETEKESPSLAFGAPNEKESYEVVK